MIDAVTMARTGLLEALESHRGALVIVGDQAIYLHTGSMEVALAEYTTDGDLALDPDLLSSDPLIEQATRYSATLVAGNVKWFGHTRRGDVAPLRGQMGIRDQRTHCQPNLRQTRSLTGPRSWLQ